MISLPERLETATEYRIRVERTGGRISRTITRVYSGESNSSLVAVDTSPLYDRQNHIGFTTFSAAAMIYDIKVYTRPSSFSINQFKVNFQAETGIRDARLEGRVFKLRIGYDAIPSKSLITLMFDDITESMELHKKLMSSERELRNLSSHIQSLREEEGSRIAREIHDELGQTLTALKIDLGWMRKRLGAGQRDLILKTDKMTASIDSAINTVRRISGELRPRLLDDLGLNAAVEWQVERFREMTGIACALSLPSEEMGLDWKVSTALFRILQEALTNIVRHAEADKVSVCLRNNGEEIQLDISDRGKGIPAGKINDPGSFGLLGMRERVRALGGEFNISGQPGAGTALVVRIPLGGGDADDQDTHC